MIDRQFPQAEDVIYLNHAGVGPWPARTRDAIVGFADANVTRGAADYPEWLRCETRLRERLARLVQADSPDDIALIKNTSEGLSFIAYGLTWEPGDEIVINRAEFPSNRIVWESLVERFGVIVRDVDLEAGDTPEQALLEAISPRTRLLAVSSVQYGSGLRMDLKPLGAACRQRDVLFCVDAIQSLGALQFNRAEIDPDFIVADGHKWMLGPEGLGLFWYRPSLRDQLQPSQYGWHMIEKAGDYSRKEWEVATTARRFECGSPNMLGIHGLEASLSVLQDEVGIAQVEAGVLRNAALLMEAIEQEPALELISPTASDRRSGIVTFHARGKDNQALYRQLMQRGVICAGRGGGVRYSPHFYTPRDKLERAVTLAAELAADL
ncbi:MAG: aminotransferase class V-fold PLP-dependent enzyme [Ectothiorhodospiraceae bacterium]|nr:aminotransferase class V-fold PLP-dependent enzyme [Paracoccaceae bacterium]MCH8505096.1 aminotransferase class V-fold PLP-dependent enzyme [Ectothiorhodospiraceae bacterium]